MSALEPSRDVPLTLEDRYTLVTGLAASHGERLRRFLASRLRRTPQDVPDLVQEVYMRLLRVSRPESIRNPEAYLFTIANHVLHQYSLRQSSVPQPEDLLDSLMTEDDSCDPASQAEMQQRMQEVDKALSQLSHRAQAAIVLYRRDGFSLEEVAAQLGVSLAMVKKYLVRAVLHCRQNIPADE